MTVLLLVKSVLLGCLVAIPRGPVGIICFRRYLEKGMISGMVSISAMAAANALWSFLVLYGSSVVLNFVTQEKLFLQVMCGLFFVLIGGVDIYRMSRKGKIQRTSNGADLFTEFSSILLMVFINPSTFLTFSVVFTLMGHLAAHPNLVHSMQISLSIFWGAIMLWIFLIGGTYSIRQKIDDRKLLFIRKLSNYITAGVGLFFIINVMIHYYQVQALLYQ